jgi:cytochrome c biogenesis protein CcmG, thiol:disulfide interchange protein DsbE
MRTLLVGIGMAVVVIVGVVVAAAMLQEDPPDEVAFQPDGQTLGPVSGSEDTPLPDGTLLAFRDDTEVSVHDWVGEPLVVNFWATWCPPCIDEMPDFQEVAEALDGQVTVLGINAQDSADAARHFADDLGITYPLVRDPTAAYFGAVRGFGWPTTLLVDADGMIRYRHTGPLDADRLRELIGEHLGVR